MAQVSKTPKEKGTTNLENAISSTGFGLFNIFILCATGGCLMSVIIETMNMMIIVPAAQCDLNLSLYEKGVLSSISFFGIMASSHLWGYIADTRGRRRVLILSLLTSSIASFISSIVPWSWLFILLRFINGFLIGGCSAIVYAYAGEFHDNRYRPKVISWIAAFVALGSMFIPGMAWLILPQQWSYDVPLLDISFRPWRSLLIIYALPSFVVALTIYFLPESPKYLLTEGKYDEVMGILKKMYSMNTRNHPDDYSVTAITRDEFVQNNSKKHGIFKSLKMQTVPLFRGKLLIKTIMVCCLHFGTFAANAGVNMWYPEILNKMSFYVHEISDDNVTLCGSIYYDQDEVEEINDYITSKTCKDDFKIEVFAITIYVGVAYAFVYIFIGSMINIVGKKQLVVGFLTVTGLAGLCSHFVYGYTTIQVLIGFFLMGGCGIGIVNAIIVDLYPTQIRAMALAVSLMFGRFGAMAGSNMVGPLIYNLCDYFFYIFALDHLIMIIIIILLPSSTELPKLDLS